MINRRKNYSRATPAAVAIALVLLLAAACTPVAPVTITLVADGETRPLTTDAEAVRDLLAQAGVTLDEDDRVVPPENTFLRDGLTVRVIRVEVRNETEQQLITYERETVRDATVAAGETRLLRAGVNGIEEITYTITLEDGVEVERRIVEREVIREPQNEVVLIGAREEVAAVPISGTIAYLSTHNAWVTRGTTSNGRRLTTSGDLDGRVFELSPDGSWLLFTRVATETQALNTLCMADTAAADVDPVRLRAEDVLWAAWAPDGEHIAYSTGAIRETPPGWEAANDLYLAIPRARDGLLLGRRRVLAPSAGGTYGWWGTTLTWAPDGERLAYARADEVGILRLYDGRMTPLLQFPPYRTRGSWVWTPTTAWTPDGEFIATVAHGPSPTGEMPEDSPVFDVFVLGTTEPLTVELASETGMWAAPSFSPDGEVIAFGRARIPYTSETSSYDLYLMDRDGSDRRLLFPQESGEPGLDYPQVAWDPWGGQLLSVYKGDLYLLTIDGDARRVTDDGAVTSVRWAGLGTEQGEEE
ncbi:MAG: G5 domain-containing protein [Anaerolineae bacterium]